MKSKILYSLLLLSLTSAVSAAPAIRVLAATGVVQAEDRYGQRQPVGQYTLPEATETLITGADSLLQLRLTDGTRIAVMPHSRIRIADADRTELIAGGMRILSGSQPQQTDTAAGTVRADNAHFSLFMQDNELQAAVWRGQIRLETSAIALTLGEKADYTAGVLSNDDFRGLLVPPATLQAFAHTPAEAGH
ncbi:MAG: FecR family protein [Pseudomonadota bacterium]|nr:FecR family protein [Pseudomonadota bacterium]